MEMKESREFLELFGGCCFGGSGSSREEVCGEWSSCLGSSSASRKVPSHGPCKEVETEGIGGVIGAVAEVTTVRATGDEERVGGS